MDNQNDQTLKLLKDVPDLRQRVLNVLKIYEYDVSTKRKENRMFSHAFWKIKNFIDRYNPDTDPPIEGGDILDWAIGNINWEK